MKRNFISYDQIFWYSSAGKRERQNRVLLRCGGHENNSDVLVPPNPKEFEMAARIGIFFEADKGMNAPSNSGSGCSRLSVGCATP